MINPTSIKISLILFFLLLPRYNYAQYDVSFSGYIIDLPIFLIKKESASQIYTLNENQLINLTRMRFRPVISLWTGARLNFEYEINVLFSKISLPGLNIESTNRQFINLNWNIFDSEKFKLTHYVDRLYFRQGYDLGDIVIGRQRISWGTGRIWNPTDLFNPLNPVNYSKIEKDGADAISAKFIFDNFTDVNIVYNPQKVIKNSNAGFRFRTNYKEFDISLMSGYFDKRGIVGFDFAGNFFDAGLRGEAIVSIDKDNWGDNYIKYILGMDNQFTAKLYGLFEYHFNGEGMDNKSDYDFVKLSKGEILNLSRNYLFISFAYQFSLVFSGSLSNNINLNDKSGFIGVVGSYSLSENLYFNFGTQLTYGKVFTEYWYYPHSVYLQGEYYF